MSTLGKLNIIATDDQHLHVYSMGKRFRVLGIFDSDEGANAYCARHDEAAVIAMFGPLIIVANKYDANPPIEHVDPKSLSQQEIIEAIKYNGHRWGSYAYYIQDEINRCERDPDGLTVYREASGKLRAFYRNPEQRKFDDARGPR